MYNTKDERNKKILEMRLKGMTYTAGSYSEIEDIMAKE